LLPRNLFTPRRKMFYGFLMFAPVTGLFLYSVKLEMEQENSHIRDIKLQESSEIIEKEEMKEAQMHDVFVQMEKALDKLKQRIAQLEVTVGVEKTINDNGDGDGNDDGDGDAHESKLVKTPKLLDLSAITSKLDSLTVRTSGIEKRKRAEESTFMKDDLLSLREKSLRK